MTEPDKYRKIAVSKESLFRCFTLSLSSVLLFCTGSLVPSIGIAAYLFSPTPLALLGAREGKKWMIVGLACASIFLFFCFGSLFFFYFFLGQGLLSFGLALPLGRLEKGSENLTFCTTVSVISKTLLIAVLVLSTGYNPFVMDPNSLRTLLSQMYSGMLAQGSSEAALFGETVEQMVNLFPYMAPSLILSYSMIDSFFNYKLCESLQRKKTCKFPPLPMFGEWRFPKSLLWALLFAFALPLVEETRNWPLGLMLEINLKILVSIFLFLQGVSLVWWWLTNRRVHFLLRVFILILLALPVFGMGIGMLGAADIGLDFRTRTKNKRNID